MSSWIFPWNKPRPRPSKSLPLIIYNYLCTFLNVTWFISVVAKVFVFLLNLYLGCRESYSVLKYTMTFPILSIFTFYRMYGLALCRDLRRAYDSALSRLLDAVKFSRATSSSWQRVGASASPSRYRTSLQHKCLSRYPLYSYVRHCPLSDLAVFHIITDLINALSGNSSVHTVLPTRQ
jgi:hypothetical protein